MDEEEFERIWAQHQQPPDDADDKVYGPQDPEVTDEEVEELVEATQQGKPIPLTKHDLHNAQFFEYEFGKNVVYDHDAKRWYIWHKGSHHWVLDTRGGIQVLAQNATLRRVRAALDAGDSHQLDIARFLLNLGARGRALEDLSSFPGIGVGDDHWNTNPTLLCVANGVIDLQTGLLRKGQQDDNINRASPVRYDASAACPRWMQFLEEVFETPELIEYVRTIVGYCLTGLTTEQVWFLLYGTGSNGKSVFVSVLESLLGLKQYYEEAAADTFVLNNWGGQSGSNNVAQLKNARLVVSTEVPPKSSFDSSRLKALTGGDAVTARDLYKDFVTWRPQFKLMMLVNHLPSSRDDSPAFWRRIRTIPFEVTFAATADPDLVKTLRGELSGILNWALSGAVTWFASGLAAEPTPAATLRADYQAESDPLAMFINDCIVETKNPADTVAAREVYRVYQMWSAGQGYVAQTEANFGRSGRMKAVGLGTKRTNSGVTYTGITVYEPGGHGVSGVTKTS